MYYTYFAYSFGFYSSVSNICFQQHIHLQVFVNIYKYLQTDK